MNNKLLKFIWAFFFLIGVVAVAVRFVGGKEIAAYNGYIPWGLWVAVYIYFVGLSAGAFLLSTMVYVFNVKALERVGKLALYLALITLVGALVTIFMDLGHPFRFWKVYVNPNFSSMMTWMIWLYTAYFILLVWELRLAARADLISATQRGGWFGWLAGIFVGKNRDLGESALTADKKKLKILGTIGVPLAIAFHGGVGALFGVVGARPYWNTPLMPILFLVSALASGGALLTAAVALFWQNKQSEEYRNLVKTLAALTLFLLAIDLLFEWAEFSINIYAAIPAHVEAYKLVLFGPYWWVFWIVHLLLGVIIPCALLLPTKNRENGKIVGVATALIAVMFLAVRANIVAPGLALEEIHGLEAAYTDFRLHFDYFPNFWEWAVTFFSYTSVMLLFYIGYKNLPLLGSTPHLSKGDTQ